MSDIPVHPPVGGDIDRLHDLLVENELLKSRVQFYEDREKHFAKALQVADGGQFRDDWDAAIQRLVDSNRLLLGLLKKFMAVAPTTAEVEGVLEDIEKAGIK